VQFALNFLSNMKQYAGSVELSESEHEPSMCIPIITYVYIYTTYIYIYLFIYLFMNYLQYIYIWIITTSLRPHVHDGKKGNPQSELSGWWFGTFFHSVGNVITPTDELHHFSEGWAQPPTRTYIIYAPVWIHHMYPISVGRVPVRSEFIIIVCCWFTVFSEWFDYPLGRYLHNPRPIPKYRWPCPNIAQLETFLGGGTFFVGQDLDN